MTYKETLEYIHSVQWRGSKPGLERIRELTEKLGDPQDSLRFIHVAGTNGKGSTCRMLASVLEKAGYKVGLFVSPFIESFNERIMLSDREITDEELCRHTEKVRAIADKMEDLPTEFELITAIAFSYYKEIGCDYVVLECGLGGRLDSTNIIKTPVLSVITGIDLDHTALLGNTHEAIAREKAGIIKKGVPVLFGEGPDCAAEVIEKKAREQGSDYYRTDFSKIENVRSDLSGTDFSFGETDVHINLHGIYQTRNTATVISAVKILTTLGLKISEKALKEGLASAYWKARFEILKKEPLAVYDGAHNPQGIASAVENIMHYLSPLAKDGRIAMLMGVMADKDYIGMISMLAPLAEKVFAVTPANSRSLGAEALSEDFRALGTDAEAFSSIDEGVMAAMQFARERNIPLLCLGSLYMYSDVKTSILK